MVVGHELGKMLLQNENTSNNRKTVGSVVFYAVRNASNKVGDFFLEFDLILV
jgi:hypothetical protein